MRIPSLAVTSLLVLASSSLVARAAAAPQSWEFRDGRWQQISSATTKPTVPDEQLDRVEQLLENRQSQSARKLDLNWLKNHKDRTSPNRDRALYLMGEALY